MNTKTPQPKKVEVCSEWPDFLKQIYGTMEYADAGRASLVGALLTPPPVPPTALEVEQSRVTIPFLMNNDAQPVRELNIPELKVDLNSGSLLPTGNKIDLPATKKESAMFIFNPITGVKEQV